MGDVAQEQRTGAGGVTVKRSSAVVDGGGQRARADGSRMDEFLAEFAAEYIRRCDAPSRRHPRRAVP